MIASSVYIIDSNVFIESYRRFYSFRIAPPFWAFLADEITAGRMAVLDVVKREIAKGTDDLSSWTKELDFTAIDRRSPDIVGRYREVMAYIQNNPRYENDALRHSGWVEANHADPWIIATAKARGYVVVTMEQPILQNLGANTSKKIRIPDICNGLGVAWIDLFEMLDMYDFSFTGGSSPN